MHFLESLGVEGSIRFMEPGRDTPTAIWHGASNAMHFHPANGSAPIRVGFYYPTHLEPGLRIVESLRRRELAGARPAIKRASSVAPRIKVRPA